ncbi:MAG: hypothetical protein R3A12_19180, partial [Ignavibacteria bacterium]
MNLKKNNPLLIKSLKIFLPVLILVALTKILLPNESLETDDSKRSAESNFTGESEKNIASSENAESYEAPKENYKWQLTFEDNFDTFDRSRWQTLFDMGNRTIWSNKELQWYKDENIISENGVLKLIAKKESIYGKDAESEKQFEYTSGMINSPQTFSQVYGK